jgi:hypothetical protein
MSVRGALLLVVALGFALLAADTTPFTTGGDAVAAVLIAAMATGIRLRWPLHTTGIRPPRPTTGHPLAPWLVLFVVAAAWEAYEYVAPGARSIHPTFSSIETAADRYYALKALVILGFMALGLVIVRRGRGSGAQP